jgi:hypothetical protein
MSLADIRAEYGSSERIGPRILLEVRRAVNGLVKHYDPVVYGGVHRWKDGIDDLIQDVTVDALIRGRQLDYLVMVSRTIEDFRRLLERQVRLQLARRRQRTIIDNILDRCESILRKSPFAATSYGRKTTYRLEGRHAERREPTEVELRQAARRVFLVPRISFRVSERAPIVYAQENLKILLRAIGESLACEFSRSDIDRILRLTLTDLLPSFLYLDEGEGDAGAEQVDVAASAPSIEESIMIREAAEGILTRLSEDEKLILARKLADVSDGDLANEMRISRPTLAKRKGRVFEILESELKTLPNELHNLVIETVGLRLVEGDASD